MRIWCAVAACVTALALTGCGSGDNGGQPGAEGSVVGQTSGGDQTPTGPDSPVAGDDEASADLPSLPIGGDASFDSGSTSTCADVAFAWNGGTLPDGVVVRITHLTYPAGVSLDTGASCDGPPCLDADSFTADQQTCSVGLSWDGTVPDGDEPSISAVGKVTCDSQDVCDQVQSEVESADGSMSVQFPESSDPSSESS